MKTPCLCLVAALMLPSEHILNAKPGYFPQLWVTVTQHENSDTLPAGSNPKASQRTERKWDDRMRDLDEALLPKKHARAEYAKKRVVFQGHQVVIFPAVIQDALENFAVFARDMNRYRRGRQLADGVLYIRDGVMYSPMKYDGLSYGLTTRYGGGPRVTYKW